MTIKEFKNLNTKIYEETLPCGLKIYICPIERHETHARIVSKFGGSYLEFKKPNSDEFVKVPAGTAHFLEHKMFEQEDGIDIMDIFQKNGALSNAFTSSFHTTYFFTSPNHFYDNLTYLLKCVTEPYYTDENVKKEVGIIEQEIKATLDNPNYKAYYTTIHNLFQKLPFRFPVAGSVESIKQINKEVLYDCYKTFYHPSNMYLVITGNVEPKKCINFIKDFYLKLNLKKENPIIIKKYNEPNEVYKTKEIVNKNITNKIIDIAYKLNYTAINLPLYKIGLYLHIYMHIRFGTISKFNKATFKDKNIIRPVDFNYIIINDEFIMLELDTEVISEKGIFELIHNNLCLKEMKEEEFELIKKNLLKSLVLSTDNVSSLANLIDNSLKLYNEIQYNAHQSILELNFNELKKVINSLDFSNHTMTIVQKG